MTQLDRSIQSACENYARRQAARAEILAARILESNDPKTHPDLAEFCAIQNYLVDVGVSK
jgi:hypothetical protein